jgi:hypothetical protein
MDYTPAPIDRYAIDDSGHFVVESLGKNVRLPPRYTYIHPIGSGGGGMVLYC